MSAELVDEPHLLDGKQVFFFEISEHPLSRHRKSVV